MALGKKYSDDGSKLFILKPKNKDDKKQKVEPHFEVFEKVEGKWAATKKESQVSGDLFKVEVKEEEYQNVKYKKVVLGFRDRGAKESYLIDLRFNLPSRNLFNMLASLATYDNLSVSYYEGNNGYDRFSLRQNDTLVPWKFEIKDLPKPIEVTFKGVVQRDYSPIDEVFEKELNTISKKLGGGTTSTAPSGDANAATTTVATDGVPPF